MSSRDLSRIVALTSKAHELQMKGHFARAVEKSAAAIAAAQELAQEDCLVVTHLQLMQVSALKGYEVTPGIAADTVSAACEQGFQMLLTAIATLERRRAAGMLLAGACRSWPEEEWYGQFLQHREVLNNCAPWTPEHLAVLAHFVGYDAFLLAAAVAGLAAMNPPAGTASSDVLTCLHFALRAIDVFEQPREILNDYPLNSEQILTSLMQKTCTMYGRCTEAGPLLPVLLARWQRFTCSGVLLERGIGAGAARFYGHAIANIAANAARLAAATLRCCSLRSCAARELHPKHFKQCGACHGAAYCCREHQLEDWPAHKAACKAARKAAAAEGGGAA